MLSAGDVHGYNEGYNSSGRPQRQQWSGRQRWRGCGCSEDCGFEAKAVAVEVKVAAAQP